MTRIVAMVGRDSWLREAVAELGHEVTLLAPDDDPAPLADAEVVIGTGDGDRFRAVLAAAPRLRWYHTLSAGVERLIGPELLARPDVALTNNRGAYDLAIAEHVMATIFVAAKRLHRSFAAQGRHEWHADPHSGDVSGATLVIVGMGSIGGQLAELARAVGMRVIGIRRTAAAAALGPQGLLEAVAEADHVALCLPLTPLTRGMIDRTVIERMRPAAWLINVSRGAVVDETALFEALSERRIAGAALDAWWEEPLPPESPWWDLPNVIVTPHTSYSSPSVRQRSLALLVEDIRRFEAGEPLLNRIDPVRGY